MRKRLVMWGSNDKDEKLLLAFELNEKENNVTLHSFTEAIATQELYNKLMTDWRENKEFEFPAEKESFNMPLSITDNILPDHIKTERTDLINQAKAEWHFTVLSAKLYDFYTSELETIKEKVNNLSVYDNKLWDEIKGFWEKVQNQMKEENLFKGHGYKLKKSTNEVFDKLKELRKVMDTELNQASAIVKKEFMSSLSVIEEKIDKGLGLQPIFNELKKLQNKFKDSEFSRSDRNKVWKRLDKAFKHLKEKRYGGKEGSGNSDLERLKHRYNGLVNAISRMEYSLNRDKKDMIFQDKRIGKTDGQLELQLRQAKIVMIKQRITSQEERLADMLKTKAELENKMVKAEAKHKRNLEKKALEEKKNAVKEKIEKELADSKDDPSVDKVKLEKAAAAIKAGKTKKTSKKVTEKPPVDNQTDAVKPENKTEPGVESDTVVKEAETNKTEPTKKSASEKEPAEVELSDKIEDAVEKIEDVVEDVIEKTSKKISAIADFVEDKVEEFIDDLKGEEEE